jgi:hypothetical protein
LDVYHNSTSDIINIKSNKKVDKIFIYDYDGALIKEFKFEKKINISELTPGVYFIGIQSEGYFEKIKIIKE